jgi:hypothetical protein
MIIGVALAFIFAAAIGVVPELSSKFRLLAPVEQNLTRAGNAFALMGFLLYVFYLYGGPSVLLPDVQSVIDNPRAHWPVITGAAVFLFGLARFVLATRECWGSRDGALAGRALLTTIFGLGGGCFLWAHPHAANDLLTVVWLALLITCAWLTLTGVIRFLLLGGLHGNAREAIQEYMERLRTGWRHEISRAVAPQPKSFFRKTISVVEWAVVGTWAAMMFLVFVRPDILAKIFNVTL